MARALRHEDPRCGREHFDARTGVDWECGPDPNDITDSIPDVPWNKLKPGSKVLFDNGQWAVTDFGLELLSGLRERYERYKIPAYELLDMHDRGRVYKWPVQVANEPWVDFDAFEETFKVAIQLHCRRRPPAPAPMTFEQFIRQHLAERYGRRPPQVEQQPCLADTDILDTTFRRARAIARQRALAAK